MPTDATLICPECGLPARITDRFTLSGAPGPVDHVKVECEGGHWSTPTTDRLAPAWAGQSTGSRRTVTSGARV